MKDWKDELDATFAVHEQKERDEATKRAQWQKVAADFIAQEVTPAFEEVKAELEKRGREVDVSGGSESAHMTVRYQGDTELNYTVQCRGGPGGATAIPVTRGYDVDGRYRAEGYFRSGLQDYGCKDLTRDEIRQHLLNNYTRGLADAQRRKNHS